MIHKKLYLGSLFYNNFRHINIIFKILAFPKSYYFFPFLFLYRIYDNNLIFQKHIKKNNF